MGKGEGEIEGERGVRGGGLGEWTEGGLLEGRLRRIGKKDLSPRRMVEGCKNKKTDLAWT